jgi:DNA invertase Pin-like site-specific DNA recombinase
MLMAAYRQRRWENVTVYEDKASGADCSHASLAQLMADVRRGRVAQIVCFKLDRFGRSLAHLAQTISEWMRTLGCSCRSK